MYGGPVDLDDPAAAFGPRVGIDQHHQTHIQLEPSVRGEPKLSASAEGRKLKSAVSIEAPDFMRVRHVGVLDRTNGARRAGYQVKTGGRHARKIMVERQKKNECFERRFIVLSK